MKVLIVKLSSLGDLLQTYPVIEYLKQIEPTVTIDWAVEKKGMSLVENHPDIHRAILCDIQKFKKKINRFEVVETLKALRETSYDLCFDLQGNMKSALITLLAKAKQKIGFGFSTAPEWPNAFFLNHRFNPPPGKNRRFDYLYLVQSYFKDTSPFLPKGVQLQGQPIFSLEGLRGKKVMVAPGSAWPSKKLTKQQWLAWIDTIASPRTILFVWGTEEEKEEVESLHKEVFESVVIPKMDLASLQNLMSQCDLVASVDSLALHLAGSTRCPTVGFFGPSLGQKYAPLSGKFYQGACPYNLSFPTRCPRLRTCSTSPCLKRSHLFGKTN